MGCLGGKYLAARGDVFNMHCDTHTHTHTQYAYTPHHTNTFYINKNLLMKKVESEVSLRQMLKQVLLELANVPKDKVEFTIKLLHRINENSD